MKKSKLKVLVYGSFGEKNVGDEVILEQLLESFDPKDKITIISKNPKYTVRNFGCHAIEEHHPFNVIRILKNIIKLRFKLLLNRVNVILAIMRCDLFVLAGGGIIVEVHQNELFKYLEICNIAKFFGKPVIVNCVGVGPLQTDEARNRIKETFNNSVDFVSVRDQHSKNLLLDCGVQNKVILTPDPAFNYKIPHSQKEKICLINLCRIYKNSPKKMDGYILEMQNLVTFIHKELGYKIKFLPFGVKDDREISIKVQAGLHFASELHESDSSYKGITDLMANASFSVTNRFHAGLISLVNAIPSFCIDHQYKAERLLDEMGLSDDLLIPLADGVHRQGLDVLDIELVKQKIVSMLKNEKNISKKIDSYMQSKKREVATYRNKELEPFIDSLRFS